MLGLIIAGYTKPFKWVTQIKDYEDMIDGRAYTTSMDDTNHIDDIRDVIRFNPADNVGVLGGAYFKIPNENIDYVASEGDRL